MDKLNSIQYIVNHNPVCEDCARGNLDQVRKAAGLYQAVKDILAGDKINYTEEELDELIRQATAY